MSNLIVTNTPYTFLNKPWVIMNGVKKMVWELYEAYEFDDDIRYPVPSWEHYCEDDNELGNFYDEVMSYLAFDDFTHYMYVNTEKERDTWYDMFDEHGTALDTDFLMLFDEMRLSMIDSADTFNHCPIIQVW